MKCFIAMAFGREDTDRLYDTLLVPVLRSKQFEPIRVDRLEHNDDIDNRIIQEIREADLLIADLTYARPSVYYEAGFAERTIPVIYTVRGDHLTPRIDDSYGQFRVHFDLQMKNLIDWIHPTDQRFANRLASRIDYVTTPILSRRDIADVEMKEKTAFSSLAIDSRIEEVRSAASEVLADAGFIADEDCAIVFGHRGVSPDSEAKRVRYLKSEPGVLTGIQVSFHTNATRTPSQFLAESPAYNLNLKSGLDKLTAVNDYEVVCAFHAIPFLNVCLEMPDYRADTERKFLLLTKELNVPDLGSHDVGEVYFDFQIITRKASLIFIGLAEVDSLHGFSVQRVPKGMPSLESRHDGFRFIYEGIKVRTIPRNIRYTLVDDIDSLASFRRRLKIALEISAIR